MRVYIYVSVSKNEDVPVETDVVHNYYFCYVVSVMLIFIVFYNRHFG